MLLYESESYAIRGAVFEVHKEMGQGFLEAVYQECLAKEFRRRNIPFVEQASIPLAYKGEKLDQTYRADFLCHGTIIVELKAVSALLPEHTAQLCNHLKATGCRLGFLVNFGDKTGVRIERIAM